MIVGPPKTPEEFQRYRDLRWKILRAPHNQPRISEQDDAGTKDYPIMVCEIDGIPIGVGRAHFISKDEAQIRSISVEQEWEVKGIGSIVLNELEKIVKNVNHCRLETNPLFFDYFVEGCLFNPIETLQIQ